MVQATTSAQGRDGSTPAKRWVFTPFDVLSLALAGGGLLWSVVAVLKVQPHFAETLADFGGPQPALTELCLKPWFPISSALVSLVISSAGVICRATRQVRMLLTGLTIFLLLALSAIFIVGIYLPLFEMIHALW